MSLPPIHRVVTGHDALGRAIVVSDGPLPTVVALQNRPGMVFHEVWETRGSPAPVDSAPDPTLGPLLLDPPKRGTKLRFVDVPPDSEHDAASAQAFFEEMGDAGALTTHGGSPHPAMHRTEAVDYGVVIHGELTLILDDAEVVLRTGSVVIQRGTNHAWANRSGKLCRILFVQLDGIYEPYLASILAQR